MRPSPVLFRVPGAVRESARVRRWRFRRRLARWIVPILVCLPVLLWAIYALSLRVEWSTFTASAPRPHSQSVPAPVPPSGPSLTMERDETHVMFGRGRIALHSMLVYTASFDAPNADGNSFALAWATADDFFPGWFRYEWSPVGPTFGLSLWVPALAASPLLFLGLLAWRRRVRPGHCAGCGYDLRATGDDPRFAGRCPECGAGQVCPVCRGSLLELPVTAPCPTCAWNRL